MTAAQRCSTYGCDLPPDHDGLCMVTFAEIEIDPDLRAEIDPDLRAEIADAEVVDLTGDPT